MSSPPPSPPTPPPPPSPPHGPPPPPPPSQVIIKQRNRGTVLPWDVNFGNFSSFAASSPNNSKSAYNEKIRAIAASPETAYAMAMQVEALYARTEEVGYRLYAVTNNEIVGAHELLHETGHVVIGRHSSCSFVINDPQNIVSLRHVLVRVSMLDDGLPILNVLDLDSGLGFELSDRSSQHAIVATGPIVFRVGTTWIVAMPMNDTVPKELPPPVIRYAHDHSHKVGARNLPLMGLRRTSEISILPKSVRLSQTEGGSLLPGGKGVVMGAYALVLANTKKEQAGVLLSERDLEHGVLIGRDPRCVNAGLQAIFDLGVSRVHALLIRERRGVVLYDIASMNGLFDELRKVRHIVLEDSGTTAYMNGNGKISMRWRALRVPTTTE